MKIVRDLENKLETLEGRAYENARMTLEKIENRTRVNTWVLENNEGTYGTEIVITKEGHVDFYLCIMERYSSKISYIRVANFQQEFSCGDIFLPNGEYKEYQKLGNIINTLNKMYNDLGYYFNNKNNRKILECARKQYEINKFINEQETETEEIEISLDEKYAKQLEESPNHIITTKIFKEIFANDDVFVGAYDVLADRFNPYYNLGKIMHKKFKELLDATINGELGLGDMDVLCTELFRTCGFVYEQFAKYDTEIKILDFKSRKKYPTYEWFMKENCWDGTRTIVDMEKIYDFEDAGLKVELFEDIEEVLIWNVTEQLEGQLGLDDIEIKEEVEEMKNKEVLDLDENLPLGTIVGFRYDVYENDVLVDKMILTGKIVYISDDFNGKYNVETNDKKTYLVYNSDIITWERPSKKEIKISITGEGRVEEITTNNIEDANSNLRRRIKEVVDGTAYCNKTWITIDIEEFEQPIEFRVDLINSLHGNVDDVLKLIIEEKERECKYVAENKEKCTWIKDTDKFISVREELIQALEGYLLPEPVEYIELTEDVTVEGLMEMAEKIKKEKEEEEPTTITKQQLTNRMKKLGKLLVDEKTIEEKEEIIYSLFPKAIEVDVEETTIHFLVNEECTGANPSKKYMQEENEHFGKINEVYGLSLYVSINKNAVVLDANVGVDYSDKWGNREYTDYTVKELEVEIPMTDDKAIKEMKETFTAVKNNEMEINSGQRVINELLQCDGLSDTTVETLKIIEEELRKMHYEQMEKKENERAVDMTNRIEKAYEEGRADKEECLMKVLKEIKRASWASTRNLYKDIKDKFEKLVEEEYIPDCRILMQGDKAVDIVEINTYNQNHSSGLSGTKIIKYAQGFFYNGDIENKLSVDQIKKLRDCGFDMDKQVLIAKEIVDEFNKQINEKKNKEMLTLRKVEIIGSDKCEYDIIFAGMNINGVKKYDKHGEQHEVIKGIDANGKIYLNSEHEYLRPLVEEKLKEKTLELFKEYKLSEYYVEETGNLCIDTGSMLYKIIDGAPTGDRVKKFLTENKDYDMKLFNDKYVDIPHYIIYRR